MKTLSTNIASRVITTAVQSPTVAPRADAMELELTEEQTKLFPGVILARNAYNAAKADYDRKRAELGLPVYEEKQTVLLYAFIGKGRKRRRVCIGEIQCAPRTGYMVPAGWQNKLVDKLTPEILNELV